MIGRQVTTRTSPPARRSIVMRGRRRNSSIQALVSTSRAPFPGTIDTAALVRGNWSIAAHLRQVAGPQPGSGELFDAVHRLGASHHLSERPLDGAGVRALAADLDGL